MRPIEQLYLELKDEYKEYRRRTSSLEQQRAQELESLRHALAAATESIAGSPGNARVGKNGVLHTDTSKTGGSGGGDIAANGVLTRPSVEGVKDGIGGASTSNQLTEKKQQYIRQMVLQYLSCRDPEESQHRIGSSGYIQIY